MQCDVRRGADFGRIDPATAQRLIAAYLPVVRSVARLYPTSERDDLESVGRVAILEAFLSFNAQKSQESTWIRRVVHWRLAEAAQRLPEDSTATGRAEVLDGHEIDHNPELGYMRALVLDNLRALTPRQSTVILAFMQGETFAEIGASLGISSQHAHVEYQTAIAQLRELVAS
jgi:RNA polymerase sigma factor (sigma-70 family)